MNDPQRNITLFLIYAQIVEFSSFLPLPSFFGYASSLPNQDSHSRNPTQKVTLFLLYGAETAKICLLLSVYWTKKNLRRETRRKIKRTLLSFVASEASLGSDRSHARLFQWGVILQPLRVSESCERTEIP